MLIKILLAVAALVAILAVFVATRPATYRVARAVTMAAPAASVFAEVNDMHRWRAWSPYDKLDPEMKRGFEGAASGQGQVYRWAGNSKAGEGSATIVESMPNELVRIRLDFLKPFAATANAAFTFKPSGDDRTTVEWSLEGEKNFLAKAVHLVMDMDKMVGGQFEEGLAALKQVAERAPK